MDALLDVKIDFFKVSVMERKCDKMTRYENSMIRVTRYLAIDLIENNLSLISTHPLSPKINFMYHNDQGDQSMSGIESDASLKQVCLFNLPYSPSWY